MSLPHVFIQAATVSSVGPAEQSPKAGPNMKVAAGTSVMAARMDDEKCFWRSVFVLVSAHPRNPAHAQCLRWGTCRQGCPTACSVAAAGNARRGVPEVVSTASVLVPSPAVKAVISYTREHHYTFETRQVRVSPGPFRAAMHERQTGALPVARRCQVRQCRSA